MLSVEIEVARQVGTTDARIIESVSSPGCGRVVRGSMLVPDLRQRSKCDCGKETTNRLPPAVSDWVALRMFVFLGF
ncbi:hypothetical protein Pla52n_05510 [Stieleria varia]|uniref:Uncharacterized protein n=1 Tax=Stieleria varia TaxID=2528005 RepID=A0A5C6BBS7_9BACT|nr:hypothetical protein Pla52n_05510 [Stieleria varia]